MLRHTADITLYNITCIKVKSKAMTIHFVLEAKTRPRELHIYKRTCNIVAACCFNGVKQCYR